LKETGIEWKAVRAVSQDHERWKLVVTPLDLPVGIQLNEVK